MFAKPIQPQEIVIENEETIEGEIDENDENLSLDEINWKKRWNEIQNSDREEKELGGSKDRLFYNYYGVVRLPTPPMTDVQRVITRKSNFFGCNPRDEDWTRFVMNYIQKLDYLTKLIAYWEALLTQNTLEWGMVLRNEFMRRTTKMRGEEEKFVPLFDAIGEESGATIHNSSHKCLLLNPYKIMNGNHFCFCYWVKVNIACKRTFVGTLRYFLGTKYIKNFTKQVKLEEKGNKVRGTYVPEVDTTLQLLLTEPLLNLWRLCRITNYCPFIPEVVHLSQAREKYILSFALSKRMGFLDSEDIEVIESMSREKRNEFEIWFCPKIQTSFQQKYRQSSMMDLEKHSKLLLERLNATNGSNVYIQYIVLFFDRISTIVAGPRINPKYQSGRSITNNFMNIPKYCDFVNNHDIVTALVESFKTLESESLKIQPPAEPVITTKQTRSNFSRKEMDEEINTELLNQLDNLELQSENSDCEKNLENDMTIGPPRDQNLILRERVQVNIVDPSMWSSDAEEISDIVEDFEYSDNSEKNEEQNEKNEQVIVDEISTIESSIEESSQNDEFVFKDDNNISSENECDDEVIDNNTTKYQFEEDKEEMKNFQTKVAMQQSRQLLQEKKYNLQNSRKMINVEYNPNKLYDRKDSISSDQKNLDVRNGEKVLDQLLKNSKSMIHREKYGDDNVVTLSEDDLTLITRDERKEEKEEKSFNGCSHFVYEVCRPFLQQNILTPNQHYIQRCTFWMDEFFYELNKQAQYPKVQLWSSKDVISSELLELRGNLRIKTASKTGIGQNVAEQMKLEIVEAITDLRAKFYGHLKSTLKLWVRVKIKESGSQLRDEAGSKYINSQLTQSELNWYDYEGWAIAKDYTQRTSKNHINMLEKIRSVSAGKAISQFSASELPELFSTYRTDETKRGTSDWLRFVLCATFISGAIKEFQSPDSSFVLHLGQYKANHHWFNQQPNNEEYPFFFFIGGRYNVYFKGKMWYKNKVPEDWIVWIKENLSKESCITLFTLDAPEKSELLRNYIRTKIHTEVNSKNSNKDSHAYCLSTIHDDKGLCKFAKNTLRALNLPYDIYKSKNQRKSSNLTPGMTKTTMKSYKDCCLDHFSVLATKELNEWDRKINFQFKEDGDSLYDSMCVWMILMFDHYKDRKVIKDLKESMLNSVQNLIEKIESSYPDLQGFISGLINTKEIISKYSAYF